MEKINTNASESDLLILKLGSNDLQTEDRCDQGNCTYYIEEQHGNTTTKLINDNDFEKLTEQIKQGYLTKYLNTLVPNEIAHMTINIVQIDPMGETYAPFVNYNEDNTHPIGKFFNDLIKNLMENFNEHPKTCFIKHEFPLARSLVKNSDTSKIIELLTKYPGHLILFNAIGSQCYGIMKTIIDYRILAGHHIMYGGVANESSTANCDMKDQIFTITSQQISDMKSETFYDNFVKKNDTKADPINWY